LAACLSGLLLGAFALAMSFSVGFKAALNYSVFTASAAAFLLASVDGLPATGDSRGGDRAQDESSLIEG
jgi:hypothetical protein